MSSTFSLPTSKHPAWKACQPFYARHVLEQAGINLKGLNVDNLKTSGLQDKSLYDYTFARDNGINPEIKLAHNYVSNWEEMKANASGLLIDDLGIERNSDFALEQVFNVIDSRYRSKKPLIITTNLTLSELNNAADIAHKRIYDRILERCIPVRINNRNIRQDNASANLKEAKKILLSNPDLNQNWNNGV